MPKLNEGAKAWELKVAGRVGQAVKARRDALGMTAKRLAERTTELGYPISRVAISKIESNTRVGKLDVAELLILAAALNMPPALLLFPNYPEGEAKLIPGVDADGHDAVRWLAGETTLPPEVTAERRLRIRPSNAGIRLVEAVTERADLRRNEFRLMIRERASAEESPEVVEETRRMIASYKTELATRNAEIDEAKTRLWITGGFGGEGDVEREDRPGHGAVLGGC